MRFTARVVGLAALLALPLGASFVQQKPVQVAQDPPQMMCCRNPGNPDMACCKNPAMPCCRTHPNGPKHHH